MPVHPFLIWIQKENGEMHSEVFSADDTMGKVMQHVSASVEPAERVLAWWVIAKADDTKAKGKGKAKAKAKGKGKAKGKAKAKAKAKAKQEAFGVPRSTQGAKAKAKAKGKAKSLTVKHNRLEETGVADGPYSSRPGSSGL